jgi:hypothetical protein
VLVLASSMSTGALLARSAQKESNHRAATAVSAAQWVLPFADPMQHALPASML